MLFLGLEKRIVLDSASVSAPEIWSAYMEWLSEDSDNAKWGLAMSQVGGDSLGSGLFIPVYLFLKNGWRVRPMEANHHLTITGNLFVDEGGSPLVNTLGNFNVIAQFTVPVQAQAMSTSGGAGLTTEQANQLTQINKVLVNDKEIKNNQLVIYSDDKVTPYITWDLKDQQGNPSSSSVFKSERV